MQEIDILRYNINVGNHTILDLGTKTYILRNTLPLDLLGSESLDWDDQLEDQGLLMVILSLIMVREGVIFESKYFRLTIIE